MLGAVVKRLFSVDPCGECAEILLGTYHGVWCGGGEAMNCHSEQQYGGAWGLER